MRFIAFTILCFALSIVPARASEVFTLDKNICASKDEKEFAEGKYVIIGQHDTEGAVPTSKDLYTATAEIIQDGCQALVHRCEDGKMEEGTLERGLFMHEVPMWRLSIGNKEWFLEMEGDKDNNAVFHGWGEYWHPTPDASWSCK